MFSASGGGQSKGTARFSFVQYAIVDLVGTAALVAHKPEALHGNYRQNFALAPILWQVAQGFLLGPAFDLLGARCVDFAPSCRVEGFAVFFVRGDRRFVDGYYFIPGLGRLEIGFRVRGQLVDYPLVYLRKNL